MHGMQVIHSMAATPQRDAHWFTLTLEAEAGTYIKEFCHSDFGRTQPNLGSLLSCDDVRIAELDVTHVSLDVFC
jgi:tRNA pseudouridine synthase 10